MYIFNINAAICGFFIWALVSALDYFFPSMLPLWNAFIFGAIVFFVGVLGELLDLKPRFFFLPIWVSGIFLEFRAIFMFLSSWIFWSTLIIAIFCFLMYAKRKINPPL